MKNLRVVVNGVTVGTISSDQYDSIQVEVKKSPRLYLAQSLEYLSAAFRLLWRVMYVTPILWFWMMAVALTSANTGLAEMLSSMQTNPKMVMSGIASSMLVAILLTGIAMLMGACRVSVIDVFDVAVNKKICTAVGVTGKVDLTVIEDAAAHG